MRSLRPTLACISAAMVVFAAGLAAAEPVGDAAKAVAFARKTLELVERAAERPKLAAELAALENRVAATGALDKSSQNVLVGQVLQLRRRIILSHPALDFDKLLINLRTERLPGHMCDQYYGRHSTPGPGLAVLTDWKTAPKVALLMKDKLPPGMTMHPDLSFDGKRVVFGFCSHGGITDNAVRDGKCAVVVRGEPQTKGEHSRLSFFLYECAADGSWVRQITGTSKEPWTSQPGRQTVLIEDWDPCYLADGRIAFVSTRSQQYGRCHGKRYVPAYVVYRCDADGGNIERISMNEANDWDPAVMHDGRIIWCRWDYINRHDTNFQSLWTMNPDGAKVAHFYGNYSVGPCMITEAQPIPGSHKVVATATDHHGYTAGSIIVIDTYEGEDGGEPLLAVTPEIGFPERGAPSGTTNAPQPFANTVTGGGRRGGGRAATPWPLAEDLFLMAYPHAGRYAIYLVDTVGGRELIYAHDSTSAFSPVPLRARTRPPVIRDEVVAGQTTGLFYVQDVYQSTQPIERGQIKRMRVNQIISQPTRGKPILSYVNNEIIKRTLGTVPVEPDGSCAFEVPADVPLQLQLLDAAGMAVMTMRTQVCVRPGEKASCIGCPEPRHATPAPTLIPRPVAFRTLMPPPGPLYDGGFSFARTVQPVLDRYCVGCHGLGRCPQGPPAAAAVATPRPAPAAPVPAAAPAPKPKPATATKAPDKVDRLLESLLAGDGPPPAGALKPKALPKPSPPAPAARPRSRRDAPPPANPAKCAGGINLLGDFQNRFTASYHSIMRRPGMVRIAQRNGETNYSTPRDYFAHAGKLAGMLLAGHPDADGRPRVKLDEDSLQQIINWLDLNAQFYGDYSFNRAEDRPILPEGEKALRQAVAERFGEQVAAEPLAALINKTLPKESRILRAALPVAAGGWGQITRGGYNGTDDPAYKRMLGLVEACIGTSAYHDIAGTCGHDPNDGDCSCGNCWVRRAREDRLGQHRAAGAIASH